MTCTTSSSVTRAGQCSRSRGDMKRGGINQGAAVRALVGISRYGSGQQRGVLRLSA